MINLKKVDETNWREVTSIKVSKGQNNYIESNGQSLLEAAYDTSLNWHPYAIYSQDNCIGFAMIGAYNSDEKVVWLDRLMLSEQFQGKGFGKQLMDQIVALITEQYDVVEIVLSVTPDNKDAIAFYTAYGFDWLDKVDPHNGEYMMRLLV